MCFKMEMKWITIVSGFLLVRGERENSDAIYQETKIDSICDRQLGMCCHKVNASEAFQFLYHSINQRRLILKYHTWLSVFDKNVVSLIELYLFLAMSSQFTV